MEKVSEKISMDGDLGTSIFLRATCACMGDECHHDLELEYERVDEFPIADTVNLRIYGIQYYKNYYMYDNFIKRFWFRLRDSVKVIFNGCIEMHYNFLFEGESQIDAYILALQEAKKVIVSRRDEYVKQQALIRKEK